MERLINQANIAGQRHGYFEEYYDNNISILYKCHFFNDMFFGYYELYDLYGKVHFKSHFNHYEEVGCEQNKKSQYYYNKPGKKFGEQITWK